jgi:hypothetical protein
MRKSIQYIDLAAVVFFVAVFGSCTKQNLPLKPEPSAFSASLKNNTVFTAAGGKDTIVVKGGTNGWWVTMPDNDWVVITKRFGSAEFNLPVTVKPNTTGAAREISVTINPTFNLPPVAIKLTQVN